MQLSSRPPSTPFFSQPSPLTTFKHWHTHRHHWVCAGTMLEVNSLLSALNAQASTLLPGPKSRHHIASTERFKKGLERLVYKSPVNRTRPLSSLNIAVNSSKPTPAGSSTRGWEMAEDLRSGLWRFKVPFPLCCSTCNRREELLTSNNK